MISKSLIDTLSHYMEGCLSQPSNQREHLAGAGATYQLEQKLCCYYSKKYAVTFCNATTALLALAAAMEIKNGEVLTTPFTWGGSVSPFLFCGSKMVYGAIENDTLNLDPKQLLAALSSKSKVVLSTDFNGIPVNSKAIKDFCVEHGLLYISDSAQSLGAFRDGKAAGCFADATVLSFSPGKSFFGGEGGAVLTDDSNLYEKLIWVSQHPARQKKHFGLSDYNEYSPINGRINPLAAIVLNELFEDYQNKITAYQAKCFDAVTQLNKQGLIAVPQQLIEPNNSTYFNLQFRIPEKVKINEIDFYLKNNALPFVAETVKPNCIPFDKTFRKQFAKKFAVSDGLNEQKAFFKKSEWIKLIQIILLC